MAEQEKILLEGIKNSDKTVVLTKKIKKILENDFAQEKNNIYLIPCCADFNFFTPLSKEKIKKLSHDRSF